MDPVWLTLQLLLMGLGIASLFVVLLEIFTPVGYRWKQLTASKIPDVNSDDFLTAMAGVTDRSVVRGGSVQILENGDEFLEQLLKDLKKAQESVTISVYLWKHGKMSDQLLAAVESCLRRGVSVRVLFDGQGTDRSVTKRFKVLREHGLKLAVFRPLKFGKLLRFYRRSHRRAIVIDGAVGYTGGIAFVDTWLGNASRATEWHDFMFRCDGKIAHSIQASFAQLWASVTGEILAGDIFYAPFDSVQEGLAKNAPFISIASSPAFDTAPLDKVWWLSIMAAKRNITIATPFLTPYPSILRALIKQARNGVAVTILLPGPYFDNHKVRFAGRGHYQSLLDAGIRLMEYQPARLHSKLIVIDSVWSIIGSANLDVRSIRLNEELVLGIYNEELAASLLETFEADFTRSREITAAEWSSRGLVERARENFWKLFEEQF